MWAPHPFLSPHCLLEMNLYKLLKLSKSIFSPENGNSNRYIPLFGGRDKLMQRTWRTMSLSSLFLKYLLENDVFSLKKSFSVPPGESMGKIECLLFPQWWLTECWFIDSISEEVKLVSYFIGVKLVSYFIDVQQVSCTIGNLWARAYSLFVCHLSVEKCCYHISKQRLLQSSSHHVTTFPDDEPWGNSE